MLRFFILAFVAFTSTVPTSAQTIDPKSVPPSTRANWCNSQISACPLLCSQLPGESLATNVNQCDEATLIFSCECADGQTPNAANFSQTIPYFLCTESNNQCVKNCAIGDNLCQSACRQNHPCGAQNPTRINTTTSSTMSATGTSGAHSPSKTSSGTVFTGLGGNSASTGSAQPGTKSAAHLVTDIGRSFGIRLLMSGMLVGFTLLL